MKELEAQNRLTLSFYETILHIKRIPLAVPFLLLSTKFDAVPLTVAYFFVVASAYKFFPLPAHEKDKLLPYVLINLLDELLYRATYKATKLLERFLTW